MDKLTQRIKEVEEQHADEAVKARLGQLDQQARDSMLILLGRIQAVDSIANTLSAQAIRALEHIEETKAYRDLGHSRFVEFLDEVKISGLTKSRYYEKKKLLDKEGDPLFDILTTAGIPMATRKLLGDGDVRIEGDVVIVRTGEEEEVALRANDIAGVVRAVNSLAASRRELNVKITKQDAEIKRQKESIRLAHEDLDRERARKVAEIEGDPHSMALAGLIGAFKNLRDEVATLSHVDRGARRDNVLELLAGQMQLTAESYGSADWARHAPRPERPAGLDPEDEYIEGLLDRVFEEGEGEGNDAELAAAMG